MFILFLPLIEFGEIWGDDTLMNIGLRFFIYTKSPKIPLNQL